MMDGGGQLRRLLTAPGYARTKATKEQDSARKEKRRSTEMKRDGRKYKCTYSAFWSCLADCASFSEPSVVMMGLRLSFLRFLARASAPLELLPSIASGGGGFSGSAD